MAPQNRKGRRAAGADSIPLARPSRNTPQTLDSKAKTLYQIAAERQGVEVVPPSSASKKGVLKPEFVHVLPTGELSMSSSPNTPPSNSAPATPEPSNATPEDGDDGDNNEDEALVPPLLDTLLSSFPLAALNFTLSFLAAHQFAQEIHLQRLIFDAVLIAFPALTVLIHFAHGHIISFPAITKCESGKNDMKNDATDDSGSSSLKTLFEPTVRNFVFLIVSILLGARLIAISNDATYYAVMKKAPPVGTLWVWCVLEMSPGFAAFGLLVPMSWAIFYKGYGIF